MLNFLNGDHKVTFFFVGRNLKTKSGYLWACRALEEGHLIGNHSYTHPSFSRISLDRARREIEDTDILLSKVFMDVGFSEFPRLFRFPFGNPGFYLSSNGGLSKEIGNPAHKERIAKFLNELCYTSYMWDVDTEDWRYYAKRESRKRDLSQIIDNCMKTRGNEIVLAHDLPITSRELLPLFTSISDQRGYILKHL